MPKDKSSGKKLADMMYGNPERAAFGITPMIGKRREDRQDREAAKSFPVDLARGVIAGAVGMPGDIESLARLPYELITGNESPTILPTSEDVLKRIPFGTNTPAGQFASGLGTLAGGSANIGAAPRMVKKGALSAARAGERMAEKVVPGIMERGGAGADILSGLAQGSRSQVIKPKGGNWLGGNFAGYIDPSIARLKPYGGLDETLENAKKSLAKMEDKAGSFKPRDIQAQRDMVADLETKVAVENWVTRNLGNYVKKQMGTPEDPVRALHEQGITHLGGSIDDLDLVADQSLRQRRAEAGFPAEGMGQSEMARKYENLTDEAISSLTAGDVQKASKTLSDAQQAERAVLDYQPILNQKFLDHLKSKGLRESEIATLAYKTPLREKAYAIGDERYKQLEEDFYLKNKSLDRNAIGAAQTNPWIEKLAPETELYSGYVSDLGFDHIIDVLKQDVQSGRIRPEQLNKVSMEQAVRRTYEYDQEMAKKMREAAIKQQEGFPLYKEYPEGYRWIELAPPTYTPETLPPGFKLEQWDYKGKPVWSVVDEAGVTQNEATDSAEDALKKFGRSKVGQKALEDALKYEGDTMGHCVGGYCPDVLEGRSRIYSLRDAKGEPHVTIEVGRPESRFGMTAGDIDPYRERLRQQFPDLDEEKIYNMAVNEFTKDQTANLPERIVQIKGKQNRAPKEDYLPFVQDFVRSGKWSDVGDIQNTGLIRKSDLIDKFSPDELDAVGVGEYLTKGEQDDLLLKALNARSPGLTDELGLTTPPPEGMAQGGRVHISDNPDVMQLELAGGGLVKRGIKAIKGAAESAGQKAPVLAEKDLTTLQDFHTSLGDSVRQRVADANKMMEGFDYKYDKGQRVFTKDSAAKNKPPYTILNRTRFGNQVMREDHPEFGQGMGRPIIDPETGKAMRTPYEPGYRVRMERGPDDWHEFDIPASAIAGDVEMASGGLVKGLKAAAKAAKAVKGTQDVLPAAEREENLQKFLGNSRIRERLYHATPKDFKAFKPGGDDPTLSGPAIWLTPDATKQPAAHNIGGGSRGFVEGTNVMPVYAQARSPLMLDDRLSIEWAREVFADGSREFPDLISQKTIDELKSSGYDSIIHADPYGNRDGEQEIIMFEPNKIKSAIGNRGTYDIEDPDITKAEGGAVRMQAGGLAKAAKALKATKEAPMKASEALGRIEGRPLVITQADRTKVGGGFLGGPGFSGLQLEDPAYRAAEAAWGVKTPGVAKMILGGGKAAGKDPVYAAMLGTPTQHQSNQMVFDKLYGDFKKSAKKGNLDPDLRDRINMRLANSVDKDGNNIFPPDVDILGKNFKDLASTFDRRAVTANLIGGMGVGGKKGQIIDYDKIIRQTTDPALIDAPTGAIGNRLFTLSGGIIDRPDLHPAFPTILQGEDLGVSFDPVVRELIMKDFMEKTMREKGRAPGVFDYTRGYPPSQLITEDLLTELQKLGLKEGGAVKNDEQGVQNPVHFTENPDAMRLALSKRN